VNGAGELKILIILVLVGFIIYFLFKLGLYIYRPFYLRKTISSIEAQYNRLLAILNKDIDMAVKDYSRWQSGDRVALCSEDELRKGIDEAMASKKHAQEVNDKFFRLRERYIVDYKKLGDPIFWYKRYLNLRLDQIGKASIYSSALTSGVATIDEFMASANEHRIAIEESEKRLDTLLDSNP